MKLSIWALKTWTAQYINSKSAVAYPANSMVGMVCLHTCIVACGSASQWDGCGSFTSVWAVCKAVKNTQVANNFFRNKFMRCSLVGRLVTTLVWEKLLSNKVLILLENVSYNS